VSLEKKIHSVSQQVWSSLLTERPPYRAGDERTYHAIGKRINLQEHQEIATRVAEDLLQILIVSDPEYLHTPKKPAYAESLVKHGKVPRRYAKTLVRIANETYKAYRGATRDDRRTRDHLQTGFEPIMRRFEANILGLKRPYTNPSSEDNS
jgi:hypothetical protein